MFPLHVRYSSVGSKGDSSDSAEEEDKHGLIDELVAAENPCLANTELQACGLPEKPLQRSIGLPYLELVVKDHVPQLIDMDSIAGIGGDDVPLYEKFI